jgi:serine protease inhibitor
MFNGSKIVPHTDSRAKLISLMLYFPDESLNENDYNKLGTSFYNSKNKNFTNTHLLDEENERLFKEQSKKFLTLPFKPYNLYGFIRTDKSWHTVEKINMHENFIRKSININILFD